MATPRRRTLTERRADELRLSIARAAMELFVAEGSTSATVERIADAAGVAPRTFYRHFAVKEDVVLPLFRRSSTLIASAIRTAPDDEDVLDVLVRAFLTTLHEDRLTPPERAFLGLMMTDPQYRMRWLEVDEALRDAVTDLIVSRSNAGVRSFQQRLAAHLVVHTAREVFEQWLTSGSPESAQELLRQGFGLVLAGLRSAEDSPSPL